MTGMRHNVMNYLWADHPGDPKVPGLRIERGRGWVFIPNTEVFDLAHTLADYLDAHTESTTSD